MANAVIIVILIVIAITAIKSAVKRFGGGCCGGGDTTVKIKPADTNKAHYKHKFTVYINGMTCAHCKERVENAFNSMPDCLAHVNLKKNCAELWTKTPLQASEIGEIVTKCGYEFVSCVEQ